MREEYDIKDLNPRKKQITINIDNDTIEYFKALSKQNGIPYQTLINLYLTDCAENNKELKIAWS